MPVALAMSVACGALYPWNAKFGYLSPGLPTKYPMHYVPEVLMVRRGVPDIFVDSSLDTSIARRHAIAAASSRCLIRGDSAQAVLTGLGIAAMM